MTATDELMALLAKATAGEWFQPDGEGGHIWNNDAEPGEGYIPDRHIVAGPNKPSWVKDRTSDEWLAENADNLAAIVAAVNFCRTELPALIAERDALREALAKATKPAFYWDSEDSENGCDDLAVIMDNHDLGYVARLQCAAMLPDQWAVGFVNDTGGFEARAFATEAEAVAFSEARATLGASHDGK